MMRLNQNKGFVVDLDPYGTPAPFLDAAVQVTGSNFSVNMGLLCWLK